MQIIDKLKYLATYRYYKEQQQILLDNGYDLSYNKEDMKSFSFIKKNYTGIILPSELSEDIIPTDILDDLAESYFIDLFKGENKFLLKRLINEKFIDSSLPVSYSYITKTSGWIGLKSYQKLEDIEILYHEIIHIFISKTKNPHINSEVLSRVFELIVAYELDGMLKDQNYYEARIGEQIESMLFNIKLIGLYPSITGIFLPYAKADYLANELFLLYLSDKEKFVYNLNKIFARELSIEEYLNINDIGMTKNNSLILEHHREVLKKV